jgi:hypothetical protein
MTKVRSTARQGAISIRDKFGDLKSSRPIGTDIPMGRIMVMVRRNQLHFSHEHDFAPLYDGCKTNVCACGAVQDQGDGEVY